MIRRDETLRRHPMVFQKCTGLTVMLFDQLVEDVLPRDLEAETQPLSHPNRQRAIGAGHPYQLAERDHLLLTVIWLRLSPIHEGLAYLLDVSDATVSRLIERVLPLLQQAGRDTMRLPDPGKKRRRPLSDLLKELPELMLIVDSFEQRVQRPPNDDSPSSGKKQPHPLKSQLVVDGDTGRMVDRSDRVPGPTADITLLERVPEAIGVAGDLAYLTLATLRQWGFSPRRKPRGQDRPPEDGVYNRAFWQFRIIVEPTLGQVSRFQRVTMTDRKQRRAQRARVAAIAGVHFKLVGS
jgi:DDE superfamily endonuclease/Helix-turn-helix of DDE superfamily endonuclease